MAITDICFCENDNQKFILEIPQGSLGTPTDIVSEAGSDTGPLVEELVQVITIINQRKLVR